MALSNSWPLAPVGDVCAIFDGPHATPEKTESGPIFLGISNLASGRLDLHEVEHLSEQDFVTWTRRVTPRSGDVVFSYETRLGEAALIPDGLRCCLGRRMALMRAHTSKVDPRYLLYAYLAPEFQEVLRSRTIHGSTVDRIPLVEFPSFPIRVPPLPEQRAIARILGALDDKIELNRRMNETLEAIARALFESWFVDFDPVRAKAEGCQPAGMDAETAALFPDAFEESALGEIPRGWHAEQFVALANITYGFPFKSSYFNQDLGLPVVRIRDLAHHFSPTLTTESFERQYVVEAGDVLIGMDGEFRAYYWQGDPALLNQRVCRVRPADVHIPQPYLYFSIQAPLAGIESSQVGTTVIHLGKKELDLIDVVLPSRGVLEAFGDATKPLFDLKVVNSKQSRTLAAIRDVLLPKLLSGEVRVGEAETMVEAAI